MDASRSRVLVLAQKSHCKLRAVHETIASYLLEHIRMQIALLSSMSRDDGGMIALTKV